MILKNESFKDYTSMKIGGIIDYVYYPNSICELQNFIRKNNVKYRVIGNGTNIIPSDETYHGYIINLKKMKEKIVIKDDTIIIPAGKNVMHAACKFCKLGYDLAYLAMIPGTFGGAVYMNSGSFGEAIGDHYISGEFINEIGDIVTLSNEEMNFKYRSSILQEEDLIFVRGIFKFKKNDNSYELLQKNKQIRKEYQPLKCLNSGSVFKNPENMKAWKIIDECGLRGFHVNDAKISNLHSNFIVNNGNASAVDIFNLFTNVKEKVYQITGIELESEWEFINW